ncbi:MAG: bifunctional glutamate N-acetyltransferase/amino-acid acetyltransferase ArgJ [Coriobacteriia bacterium]|nr:bifunctional glutamate N-acetyltransferase/amino-acid acetyltransferase ArgJ [Coriobacteriia bacterium]
MDPLLEILFRPVDGGVTAPRGFRAGAVAAGLKKGGRADVAVLAAETAVPAAAVFTTNLVAAAPVVVSREHIAAGRCRAVAVNAGNANACTGAQGLVDARAMASATARALGCAPGEVIVSSTGVIGVPLPVALVTSGIEAAATALSADGGSSAAEAIMTTDTFAKEIAVTLELGGRTYTVGGMAKGSGMIQPNMATMLAFVTTDAPLTPEACDAVLRAAVDRTFNRISIDSDTSTNDMCLLMASGAAGGEPIGASGPAFEAIAAAVHHVCGELARLIVRDGEGASKFIEVVVRGAESEADATRAAFAIANSPLFKTAVFGGDANWGRVAMAVGKSGARVDPDRLEIVFAGIPTCVNGTALLFDEQAAAAALAQRDIVVLVDLHLGAGTSTVWTCDLTYDYVRINGDYRS